MIHADIANRASVSIGAIEDLFRGVAHKAIEDRLGVPMGYIEDYINRGSAAAALADCLGFNMLAAEELGSLLGKEGRVGLLIGLLIAG
jgi:hypothetical protein